MTTGSFFWEGSQQGLAFASQQLNLKVCGAFHTMDPFLLYDALWMLILKTSFPLTDLVPTTKHLQTQGKFDSGAELHSSGQYFLPFPVSESFLILSRCPSAVICFSKGKMGINGLLPMQAAFPGSCLLPLQMCLLREGGKQRAAGNCLLALRKLPSHSSQGGSG